MPQSKCHDSPVFAIYVPHLVLRPMRTICPAIEIVLSLSNSQGSGGYLRISTLHYVLDQWVAALATLFPASINGALAQDVNPAGALKNSFQDELLNHLAGSWVPRLRLQ